MKTTVIDGEYTERSGSCRISDQDSIRPAENGATREVE